MSTNLRYKTEWTSEDSIQYRLAIIPSDAVYTSGFTDVVLPSDFLLRDMTLETENGEIPAGLTSQVLNVTVNLASLQGTNNLVSLREQLLRGTTTLKYPKTNAGVDITTVPQFQAFNTFILQYNDGSGYKTMFIGCQKYSATNELEITSLENVVKLNIELFDITRCIGEAITETAWCEFLKNVSDTSGGLPENELSFYDRVRVGYDYRPNSGAVGRYWAVDIAPTGMSFRIQRLDKIFSKINDMYSAYFRTLTQNASSSYTFDRIWLYSMTFYQLRVNQNTSPSPLVYPPFIVTEIYNDKGECIGGALRDSTMFAQFQNFHDVLKILFEQSLQTYRLSYTQSGTNPQSYAITYTADTLLPGNYFTSTPFDKTNIYGSVKVKLLSETLNQFTVNMSTMKGSKDVEEYVAANQSTSSDNSKDINAMLHNLPIVTDRADTWSDQTRWNYETVADDVYVRNAITSGMLVYILDNSGNVYKVDTKVGATSYFMLYYEPDYYFTPVDGWYENAPLFRLYMYFEQTRSLNDSTKGAGIPNVTAQMYVDIYGNEKQAVADFTTTFGFLKYTAVGMSCIIDFEDLNPLLASIYGTNTANAVVLKTSHNIYTGMVDTSLRIHGLEPL